MRLLRHIFARFNTSVIDGWSVRGKVSWHSITIESGSCSLKLYLDYANIIIILEQQEADCLADSRPAVPDAVEAAELARLAVELPKLIPLIPDVVGQDWKQSQGLSLTRRAAVERMSNELARRGAQLESMGVGVGMGMGMVRSSCSLLLHKFGSHNATEPGDYRPRQATWLRR